MQKYHIFALIAYVYCIIVYFTHITHTHTHTHTTRTHTTTYEKDTMPFPTAGNIFFAIPANHVTTRLRQYIIIWNNRKQLHNTTLRLRQRS